MLVLSSGCCTTRGGLTFSHLARKATGSLLVCIPRINKVIALKPAGSLAQTTGLFQPVEKGHPREAFSRIMGEKGKMGQGERDASKGTQKTEGNWNL